MHRLDEVQARELTLAAVGAVNRRDHLWSVDAVRCLVSDERTRVVAIDTCAVILLRGVPRGSLERSVRIPISVPATRGDATCARASEVASEVLSGLACGDDQRVALVLARLTEDQQFDAVLVLVRAAAAWIDTYVGIDGDTVDAYYAISKTETT
ncbi:hypothetical protein SAMN04488074_101611 [Lentzea albidocapillata subsp. violacea]|uniref:Uncharacterized protein n=1 Tax=Lentzea albidocapillata subsp. violacea TaxID=128104 RepID=A0A1G8RA80_9PSEU|nr:hypothetical protein [Lentzea albidocapillata]SDJ13868.1 hypothetical protein SAMN04488074_101611 [Lentzea albidocapillata subsp. violacea]